MRKYDGKKPVSSHISRGEKYANYEILNKFNCAIYNVR